MSNATLRAKYAETLRKLHVCSPAEKKGLNQLLTYYYNLKTNRGI